MTREQSIRHECLLQLYGARPHMITADFIARIAKRQGDDFLDLEIEAELVFLKDQNFVEERTDPGTGETRYRLTSAGVIHYEKEIA